MNGSLPYCRVCFKTSLEYIDLETPFPINGLDDMDEISSPDSADGNLLGEFTYLDCFRECTRLDVELQKDVSQSLCGDCGFELRIAYQFIKKAENAAKILEKAPVKTETAESNRELHISKVESGVKLNDYREAHDDCSMVDIECVEPEINTNIKDKGELPQKLFHSQVDLNSQTAILEYNDERFEIEYLDNEENSRDSLLQKSYETYIDFEESEETSHIDSSTKDVKKRNSKRKQLFKCDKCEDTFSTNRSLQSHRRTKHLDKEINCEVCFDFFPKEKDLQKHTEEVHSHVVACSQCEFQGKEYEMREHEEQSHAQTRDFLCNICSKTFSTLGVLNAHLKYHERKQANLKSDACETCGKQFSTKHYLRLHMEVHKNDRELHKCNQCDKMYVTKTALDNHMKLHNGETIKCVLCEKEFSRQYELNVHMRFHTRDYPFECEVCGKKFAIKGHLRTHMWRHQGLKLQCEDCGKLFTSSKALQEHSFTHSEMPFPCSYCSKAYPSKQKFKVHLKTAHNVELNDDELQKVFRNNEPKPLVRKKLTLVQADSVMKEEEVKTKNEESEDIEQLAVELY